MPNPDQHQTGLKQQENVNLQPFLLELLLRDRFIFKTINVSNMRL